MSSVASASGRYAKAANELRDEVRAEGYLVELRKGHTFYVFDPDEPERVLAHFGAHPKQEAVVAHARRDLRNKGILPGKGGSKKGKDKDKEVAMATVSPDQKREAQDVIAPRLRAFLDAMGGDTRENRATLEKRAVEIIHFRRENGMHDVEQFGSTGSGKSTPVQIARESMRGLLEGRGGTAKSIARWTAILDTIEKQEETLKVAAPTNGHHPEVAETAVGDAVSTGGDATAEMVEIAEKLTAEWQGRVKELEERAELAESVVHEIEQERDAAKANASAAAGRESVVRHDLGKSEARVEQLLTDLEAARSGDATEEIKRLERRIGGMRGGHARSTQVFEQKLAEARRAVAEATASEQAAKDRLATVSRELAEVKRDVLQAEQDSTGAALALRGRDELVEQLQADVVTLRAQAESSGGEFRVRYFAVLIDQLLNANGAPNTWILERLDRLAGIES